MTNDVNEPWSDAVYKAAVEAMAEAVVAADGSGTIRLWNRGAERLFGFTAQEALGAPLSLIVPERFRPAHDEGFARALETGHLRVADRVLTTRATHKEGNKLYVDFSFSLLKDGAGRIHGALAVGRDATARQLEAAARRAEGG